jgi:hypothetical protein
VRDGCGGVVWEWGSRDVVGDCFLLITILGVIGVEEKDLGLPISSSIANMREGWCDYLPLEDVHRRRIYLHLPTYSSVLPTIQVQRRSRWRLTRLLWSPHHRCKPARSLAPQLQAYPSFVPASQRLRSDSTRRLLLLSYVSFAPRAVKWGDVPGLW